jgi:hypothetical protein
MYVCVCVCLLMYVSVCVYVCMRVCMYVCMCVYACMHVCIHQSRPPLLSLALNLDLPTIAADIYIYKTREAHELRGFKGLGFIQLNLNPKPNLDLPTVRRRPVRDHELNYIRV